MSSKVIKWFKRQASIRRFTEKKDEHKTVSGSKEPSDEKKKLSFGRLSFRKKHKRKPSSTAEIEGNLAIVGISKKYSYSVPNEMEGEKVLLTNGATNAVSLNNSSCTNSPTKTDSTSKSVSELSYHSSFDNEAHSSEFSREFDNTPLLADSPKNESEKLDVDSAASKLSDAFHSVLTTLDKSALESDTLRTQSSSKPDQTDHENSSNLGSLSSQISSAKAQMHPQDIKKDKTVIPTIVIESVPNKPPLAVVESYSSDDLSGLSEIDDTDMNKDCESVISVEEEVRNFEGISNLVENAKSGPKFGTMNAASTSEISIELSDSISFKEINTLAENIESASNIKVKESSCAEFMPISEITIAECDIVKPNAGNDVQPLNSLKKSEENFSIKCVKEIYVNNHNEITQNNLNDDTTPPSSCDSISSVINVTELQTLEKDKEIFESGSAITNDNIPIPDVAQNASCQATLSESPTTDNFLVRELIDSPSDFLNSSNNKNTYEKIQVEVLELKKQVEENKNLYPKVTEDVSKDESIQPVQALVTVPESRNQIAHVTPAKKTTEYPEDLNPFGEDTEEEESSSVYPHIAETEEINCNPFGNDNNDEKNSEHTKNAIFLVRSNGSIAGNSESISSSKCLQKMSSSEPKINKKSLNPFGDSDDEGNDDRNDSSQTLCKGEIPPRLPPKSDFQKRKYSGASLAPVPRPRKTKQHHGSTTSLQNVSTFPVPAPRSITPFGSTRTLNESVSSMNPFDEEEDDDPSCGSFERRGMGRNTTQLQSTSSEGARNSEESFPRNGVRASLPSTGRFRPKKKRQAPLPPGTVINKPPHSPMPSLVNSIHPGHRKRSSTSPSSDVVFEVKPRGSKSPSPRRTPPPRPPLPSQ